jgi:2-polyprenyl-6-hydroxyphenyl methylase / 3-demethylubiquinone-9 3-methyltransferase
LQSSQSTHSRLSVNNDIYSTLGERWYQASDDPVALLRAEAQLRNPWVAAKISAQHSQRPSRVLDIGCGGGFLTNHLAKIGHHVTGLDAAADSLAVAASYDQTKSVSYDHGDARALPYPNGSFDAVCAMDFLEHVEDPERVIAEVSRVLAPSGLFFFHTFNRNFLSWLVVIKGVEWFVKNTPVDMHILRLFLKPSEVRAMCDNHGMETREVVGSRPVFGAAMFKMLRTGIVPPDFRFTFSSSTHLAYTGYAQKNPQMIANPAPTI